MRYIAINELSVDTNWLNAAKAAAEEVRLANPEDRSRIINKHQTVWKDLKEKLRTLSHEKCWYCESIDARSDNAVDHYRPKGNVKGADPAHDGYWWLAFDWQNYRFSCGFCNSIHRDPTKKTSGGKQDYFRLWNEQERARLPGEWNEQESARLKQAVIDELPLLLDPTNPLDVTLIAFADDGSAGTAVDKAEKPMEHAMATESIERYHLNHPRLTERRAETLRIVRTWVEEADQLLDRHAKDAAGFSRNTAKARMQDIMRAVSAKAEYSTAVKHLLAALAAKPSDAAKSVLKSV